MGFKVFDEITIDNFKSYFYEVMVQDILILSYSSTVNYQPNQIVCDGVDFYKSKIWDNKGNPLDIDNTFWIKIVDATEIAILQSMYIPDSKITFLLERENQEGTPQFSQIYSRYDCVKDRRYIDFVKLVVGFNATQILNTLNGNGLVNDVSNPLVSSETDAQVSKTYLYLDYQKSLLYRTLSQNAIGMQVWRLFYILTPQNRQWHYISA